MISLANENGTLKFTGSWSSIVHVAEAALLLSTSMTNSEIPNIEMEVPTSRQSEAFK